ncbi:hypothetical protein C0584_02340 [Candidatus Parcubacteria bacterium]|nr:MAG: hypothetical protein C0584_02340 [Candidatus Parcubacteria bacterium]
MKKIENLISELNALNVEIDVLNGKVKTIQEKGSTEVVNLFNENPEVIIILGSEYENEGYNTEKIVNNPKVKLFRYALQKELGEELPGGSFIKLLGFCSGCYDEEYCGAIELAKALAQSGHYVLLSDRRRETLYSSFGEWKI